MKEWRVAKINREEAVRMSKRYGLPAFLSMLLSARGINEEPQVREFLSDKPAIAFPDDIIDMDKAVERIRKAVDKFEKICVFGDYDADGVTSTALLYSYLNTVGANVMYYIPDRETQGYGMNKGAVDFLHAQGVSLIVTVDNGISAIEEIAYANSLGIDTVVTDHHTVGTSLPPASAVVDMHRPDCPSRFKELSGVGVAFKLVMALEGSDCDVCTLLENYSDLVAIGTVGDIVTLKSENRAFVKSGLSNMLHTERAGIIAILEESGLLNKPLTAGRLSFTVVPRINAVGRLGTSEKSVNLLLTDDRESAAQIAKKLGEDNSRRQAIEKDILAEINGSVAAHPELLLDRVTVIEGEGWHQGVIGIVAARVKELTGKPCIIITRNGDNAKGSGRSMPGFSLCDAVFSCRSLLEHCGGHPMAVGLSLKSKNISEFRKKLNEYARETDMPYPRLEIDCKLNPAGLSLSAAEQIKYLEPFGAGNPAPVFGLYGMRLSAVSELGGGKHLQLTLQREDQNVKALLFFTEKKSFPYIAGDVLDLAVALEISKYNSVRSLSVIVKEIKLSAADNTAMLEGKTLFESFMRDERITPAQVRLLTPQRDEFALVYRFLRKNAGFCFSPDILCCRLENKISYAKLMVILTAMQQLSLVKIFSNLYTFRISLLPAESRVDLSDAPILRRIREGEIKK